MVKAHMKYKQSEKTNEYKTPSKTKTLQLDSRVSGNPERFLRRTAEPLSEPWHQLHFSGKAVSEEHPAELDEWKQVFRLESTCTRETNADLVTMEW